MRKCFKSIFYRRKFAYIFAHANTSKKHQMLLISIYFNIKMLAHFVIA